MIQGGQLIPLAEAYFRGVNAPASLKLGLAVGIQRQADLFPGSKRLGLIEAAPAGK